MSGVQVRGGVATPFDAPPFVRNDGGRADAGYRGGAGDCVCRSIAIATGKPYREVYDALHEGARSDRRHMAKLELRYGVRAKRRASPRNGVYRRTYDAYLKLCGWEWVPTMFIGSGCKVHLRADELPSGRLVVALSKHMTAVIDGTVHDTHDPARGGMRCVYGYYRAATV